MALVRRFYYKLKSSLLFDILRNNYFILVALIILLLVFINSKSIFVGLIFIGYLVYLLKKAPKQPPHKLWIPFFHNDTFSLACYDKSISEKCM